MRAALSGFVLVLAAAAPGEAAVVTAENGTIRIDGSFDWTLVGSNGQNPTSPPPDYRVSFSPANTPFAPGFSPGAGQSLPVTTQGALFGTLATGTVNDSFTGGTARFDEDTASLFASYSLSDTNCPITTGICTTTDERYDLRFAFNAALDALTSAEARHTLTSIINFETGDVLIETVHAGLDGRGAVVTPLPAGALLLGPALGVLALAGRHTNRRLARRDLATTI
jgi:hypothetical protein